MPPLSVDKGGIRLKRFFEMMKNTEEYIQHRKRGYQFIERNITDYHSVLHRASDKLILDSRSKQQLRTIFEGNWPNGFLPMSNRYVRKMAWSYLADAMAEFWFELVAHGNMPRFWFLTCCWDDGFTFVDNPEIDFASMTQKVRNALSENGLNGITALETHPFRDKWVGEGLRRLCAHSHSIVWTDDADFDPFELEGRMQKRFPNILGAKGFKFSTRAQYVQKELQAGRFIADPGADMTVEDLIYLAAYMVKAPNAMKRIVRDKDDPTKISLKTTSDSYSGKLALQTAQIWSQMSPFDTIFGTGEGAVVRNSFAQEMRDYEKRNRGPCSLNSPAFDISRFWADVGAHNRGARLGNSLIIR
jgi:hypothetical protein